MDRRARNSCLPLIAGWLLTVRARARGSTQNWHQYQRARRLQASFYRLPATPFAGLGIFDVVADELPLPLAAFGWILIH